MEDTNEQRPLQNAGPASSVYGPPFSPQKHTSPGLAIEREPKPDHGETSYQGRALERPKALVTGGDSGIGRAVAIAFAREGADVAFNYLSAEEKDATEVWN